MTQISLALVDADALSRPKWRDLLESRADFLWLGEASSAETGLALIEQTRPDVALIDLALTERNGIALTAEIKARSWPTRILILTLDSQPRSVLGAFGAGADSYCLKDIRPELLTEAINATHRGQTWIDPAVARVLLTALTGALPENNQSGANFGLTEREREILQLVVDGLSNAEIAQKLYITVGTVKTHVRNILHKLGADDRTQAAVRALRSGLAQ
ncbi:MAG: response regulator [Cyanobacteria bacterium RI_101]|nr:response regulator [Cyanobacteria bacterium RI_101]